VIRPEVYTEIVGILRRGASNKEVCQQISVDHRTVAKIRREQGIPRHASGRTSYATVEEAYRARVEPAGGQHLRWSGGRSSAGTPVFMHAGQTFSAYRVAFTIRTGREPVGHVFPACDVPLCVAPECMDDTAARNRDRAALASLLGRQQYATHCPSGHAYGETARYLPDGDRYCSACRANREASRG
jgi:hypothetical protein